MEQNCTAQRQLKARYLSFLVGLLLLLKLLVPHEDWMILLVGVGGAWLLSYRLARLPTRAPRRMADNQLP